MENSEDTLLGPLYKYSAALSYHARGTLLYKTIIITSSGTDLLLHPQYSAGVSSVHLS